MTIRTALLDARFIFGDATLFAEFQQRFRKDVLAGKRGAFIEAKLAEHDARHARAGASRYLRRAQRQGRQRRLARSAHAASGSPSISIPTTAEEEFVEAGVFTRAEYRSFRRCEDFLWAVRCHLHFMTGRAEERLSFDLQPQMAERLGYTAHGGLSAVERFMKHYFLVAKEVGDLTRIVCSASR